MSNYHYDQLAGALGVLKQNDVDLPWGEINEKLRKIAAEHGPENCDTDEVREMHREYRDKCLEMGFIRRGELFNHHDIVPLI